MNFSKDRKPSGKRSRKGERPAPKSTGSQAEFLRKLVDSRNEVTVVLKTGEHLKGRIRYYDRDCFSLGLSDNGPNLFLRKNSVLYVSET